MEQKIQLHGVLSLFLLVVTVLLIYSVFWGPLSNLGGYPTNTVSVSASGKTVARPDVARISFSVVSEGTDTAVVTDENNTKMNDVVSYLKGEGIDEKDIQTTAYNLSPVYSQPLSRIGGSFVPTIVKYTLTQTVRIQVRDFSKISPIMSKLITLGVNSVDGVSFGIDNEENVLAQARADAFQKVREKAKNMAKEGGFRLGKLVNVNEYGNMPYDTQMKSYASGMGGMEGPSVPAVPSIEPGSSEVTVQVNLVYEIR